MTERHASQGCDCSVDRTAADDASRIGPTLRLALGVVAGLVVPLVVGAVNGFVVNRDSDHASMVHTTTADGEMIMRPSTHEAVSWLGQPEWFYGALTAVLVLGAGYALVRRVRNSCGSTPVGMGIMWGSMIAMSLGMAVGVH